jgi:hypothetical protein
MKTAIRSEELVNAGSIRGDLWILKQPLLKMSKCLSCG